MMVDHIGIFHKTYEGNLLTPEKQGNDSWIYYQLWWTSSPKYIEFTLTGFLLWVRYQDTPSH